MTSPPPHLGNEFTSVCKETIQDSSELFADFSFGYQWYHVLIKHCQYVVSRFYKTCLVCLFFIFTE